MEDEGDDIELLRKYYHRDEPKSRAISQAAMWIEIMQDLRSRSAELHDVFHLLLIIPNGTAELERIFSVVKAMKSKARSKLKSWKLEAIIEIFYFVDLNYSAEEVYALWNELMK